MAELPDRVLGLVENKPVEDMLLAILRHGLPEIPSVSTIAEDPPPHFILVRRAPGIGDWNGDPRFTDTARFDVHTYTEDPDGDWKGAMLQEAIRVVMRTAWLEKWSFPDTGSVIEIALTHEPARQTDWATSAGPVQFADLPTGYWRYESTYSLHIRKPPRK